jgi:preprotein translocase subunit SecE
MMRLVFMVVGFMVMLAVSAWSLDWALRELWAMWR